MPKEQSQYIRQAKHTESEKLRNIRLRESVNGIGKIAERWKFLIDDPFNASEKCCDYLTSRQFELHPFKRDIPLNHPA